MSRYSIIVLALLFACLLPLQAQDKNPDLQRELTIEKEYSPSLNDAHKLNRLPEVKEPDAPDTKVEFSNYTLDYLTSPHFRRLETVDYLTGFADSDKRGYLTAGFGTLLDVDIDAGYQILRSETDRLSVFASHRSSNSRVSYLQYDSVKGRMKFNDNLVGMDFRHRFQRAVLSADAQYTRSAFNYYGFPFEYSFDAGMTEEGAPEVEYALSFNQVNSLMKTHLGLVAVEGQDLDYRFHLTHTLLKHKLSDVVEVGGKTENRILLDGGLYTHINAITGIGLDASIKTYFYRLPHDPRNGGDNGNSNYLTATLNPHLTFEGDTWDARLGVKGHVQLFGVKKFLPSPDIRFRWRPVDPVMVYLTADGGIKDNSAYNIYYENRYLNPTYRILDSKSLLDATLGISFSPMDALGINLFSGYRWVDDEHFYSNEWIYSFLTKEVTRLAEAGHKMLPVYADARVFQLGGSVQYHYRDRFNLSLKLVYDRWTITGTPREIDNTLLTENIAPNKPVFSGDWDMGYRISTLPLRIHLNYHLETGRKAVGTGFMEPTVLPMKDIHDVSATATWTFDDSLSVFAKVNNLLFQNYDLWYRHPAQGFNIMLGANLKF
jgi:hypothetical protein